MKKLIATRSSKEIQNVINITHPIFKKYAQFCNADFIDDISVPYEIPHPHFRILGCKELLKDYDRILILDSDTLILKDCENIFNIVSETHIGSIFEDVGSRQEHRRGLIKQIQQKRGNIGWTEGYINTGVFVLSKEHSIIFDNIDVNQLWVDFGQDDVELGYWIHKLNIPVFELEYKFNHMSMFSENWHGNKSRFDSYCIHFAGNGFNTYYNRFDQLYQDYLILNKYKLLFGG